MATPPKNPFRDHIDTKNIIGYQEQRKKLSECIAKETNFIILEGEIGSGKTTLIEEAKEKFGGIYVDVGTVQNIRQQISNKMGIIERVFTRPDAFEWLSRDNRLVLYLDENKFLEPQALLHIKQATSKNSRLTTVIALTPRQILQTLDDYTELERRIHLNNRIMLPGLSVEQLKNMIQSYQSPIVFEQTVIESIVQESKLPQSVKKLCEDLYDYASDQGLDKITTESYYAFSNRSKKEEKTRVNEIIQNQQSQDAPNSDDFASLKASPLESKILSLINEKPGLKRGEIAEKMEAVNPNSVGNSLLSLNKKYMIQKRSGRYFPYGIVKAEPEMVS